MTTVETRDSERAILFFTCAAHALTHIYMLVFTAVLVPMQEAFGLSLDEFTAYATVSTVLFGVGALPAGWLGDRVGEKQMLVGFFLLTAFGGVCLGLAQELWSLAIGMALVGLGCSIFHPVGNAMISKGFRRPGKAMGMNGLWGSLGIAVAPIFAVQVTALLSWRWAYFLLTLPTIVLGLRLMRARLPDVVCGATLHTTEAESSPSSADDSTAADSTAAAGIGARVGAGWISMLIALLLAMLCGGLYFHLITTMLPSYLADHLTVSSDSSIRSGLLAGGYAAGLIYAVGGFGQVLAGHLVHNREGRGLYFVLLAAAAPLIILVGHLQGSLLVAVAAVMAVFVFAVQPVENILLARYSPTRYRGLVFGSKFILAFGVGGLGAYVSGYLSVEYGMSMVFTVSGTVTALAAFLALIAWLIRVPDQFAGE